MGSVSPGDQTFHFCIQAGYDGVRLDHYLVQALGEQFSRSQIIASIKSGQILVDGKAVKAGWRLRVDNQVVGRIMGTGQTGVLVPQPVDFEILLEESSFLAINKPPGLVVHPGAGNKGKTLVNGILYRYRDIAGVGEEERPGIVHRLDKDTSGLLLIARTIQAHRNLAGQFKDRTIKKKYLALVHGRPEELEGRIAVPIGRHPVQRQKMAVRYSGGRFAVSNWKVLSVFTNHALLEIGIETGRMHQIRVHLAHIGHPVVGDLVYGPNRKNDQFPRQMLHAEKISFLHPDSGDTVCLKAPLPDDFERSLQRLETGAC